MCNATSNDGKNFKLSFSRPEFLKGFSTDIEKWKIGAFAHPVGKIPRQTSG